MSRMRITLELPAGLLEEVRTAGGFTSNAETVEFALRELVRRRRADALKALFGRVSRNIDIPRSRRRPPSASAYERAQRRALARLREGLDLRWIPSTSRDECHKR